MGAIKALRALLGLILCLVLGVSVWLTVQGQVFHQEETAVAGMIFRPVEKAPGTHPDGGRSGGDPAPGGVRYGRDSAVPGRGERQFSAAGGHQRGELHRPGKRRGNAAASFSRGHSGKGCGSPAGAGTVYEFLGSWWGAPVIFVVGILLQALPTLLGVRKPSRRASAEEISTEERPAGKKLCRERIWPVQEQTRPVTLPSGQERKE